MVSNKKRVTKKVFNQIMKTNFSVYNNFFNIIYFKKEEKTPSYAVVVPRGVSRKATERNKLKRKGYAVLRLFVFKNVDFIVFYKKNGAKLSFEEIKQNIVSLLKKSKII